MNLYATSLSALCIFGVVACHSEPDPPSDDIASASSELTVSFSGSLSSSGTSWVTHSFTVDAASTIDVELSWPTASADLNLFLYSPSGETIAFQNGAARPEVLTAHVDAPGTYKIGIKCKTGSTSYAATVDVTPDYVEQVFSGNAAANAWIEYQVPVLADQPIQASLGWTTASANLNLFLYDPSGTLIDFANGTTEKPETVSAVAAVSGNYKVAIKAKTGSSNYTLTVGVGEQGEPPVPEHEYPGRPAKGTLYWGAGVGGNASPVSRHETPAGHPLTVHRTFFQWNQRTSSMITMANDDSAHGRLPWVSVKPPSWAEMANGTHDAAIDQMLTALDAVDGPVWLTIHHEPEGGGGVNAPDDPAGPAGHVAMNQRVRQRMSALGVDNVALAPILMSYTWNSVSGRNPEEWWAPGIYDFLGVDHYKDAEASPIDSVWSSVRLFAADKGVELAVGEWGMRGTNAAAGDRMEAFYDHAANSHLDGQGARVVGLSYFDSGLNSPSGSWELQGEQLTTFWALLGDPRTADPQ
ncbi:MAG: hypothetical protein HOW73_13365 [Polyangiaceae bacterium]|nr:hypothetical protein [Polyangiaceae bacterium]